MKEELDGKLEHIEAQIFDLKKRTEGLYELIKNTTLIRPSSHNERVWQLIVADVQANGLHDYVDDLEDLPGRIIPKAEVLVSAYEAHIAEKESK